MDLITIIVPVYNVERFLPVCVESILQQTYRNLQILLINDGSTDSCPQICDEYALKDTRIEVIHKLNGGLSDARNFGIEHAKGQYITFVDSDDVIASDMVEYLYLFLKKNHADISVCQPLRIAENGNSIDVKKTFFKDFVVSGNLACFHEFMAFRRIGIIACGKLYRTGLFREVRFPVERYHEDVFTTYKLIALSDKIAVGSKKKYGYRIRTASITQSSFSPKHLDAVIAKEELADFIIKHYPKEQNYAKIGIVYSATQCVFRMGCSHCYDKYYMHFLQSRFRAHEGAFLCHGKCKISTKIISIFSFFNVSFTIRIISLISKLNKLLNN